MATYKLNESDKTLACDILGYLNFSSGSFDAQFMKAWNGLFDSLTRQGSVEVWKDSLIVLRDELNNLVSQGGAFLDSRQSFQILDIIESVLKEYRIFHKDVLFSVDDTLLFNAFFMARVSMFTTREYCASDGKVDPHAIVINLSDFLGYRPIPVLADGIKHEANLHEWIAPIPLFHQDVGVVDGPYRELVEIALEILKDTDKDVLFDASFDLDNLTELSMDPRPFDFDQPVAQRLNYRFGTWDERSVDGDGFFRRFVVQRTIVDCLMERVWQNSDARLHKRYMFEAGALLAGSMLMGSGVSGGYVQAHDSSTTLESLVGKIAAYRDLFYEKLIKKVPQEFREALEEEEKILFQPFGGVRQALNRQLSDKNAEQMHLFALARTYARMGYYEASARQAAAIETISARLLSRIDCCITKAHLCADVGNLEEAASCMPEIEDLLRRGIECGALPDPWFILGFDSQYNLFPAVENGIHDHRLDTLIDLLNDIFDLYSRLQKEAAAAGNSDLRCVLSEQMSDLAGWWDQYGSVEVNSVEGFSGQEVWESAAVVSTALAAWSQAGKCIGDIAFWRSHVERFKSPKAFVLLGEALLEKEDWVSCASLLIYWLDQSFNIPLTEDDYSFNSLANNLLEQLWRHGDPKAKDDDRKFSKKEYLVRWNLTKSFLDRIEANAGTYWEIPRLELSENDFDERVIFRSENPVLAEFTRRLLGSIRYSNFQSGSQRKKIIVQASLKDAARVFDSSNLPQPEELELFYRENKRFFPDYLTYSVYVEIFLGAMRLSPEVRKRYFDYAVENQGTYSPSSSQDECSAQFEEESLHETFEGEDDFENERDLSSINRQDERKMTGSDPLFNAAYDGMSFSDSADDGNADDTCQGNSFFNNRADEDDAFFSNETNRISERLLFVYSMAKLWKIASEKSPLLHYITEEVMDEEELSDARIRIEEWLKQARSFRDNLYELLDQASRYRIQTPTGSVDSLEGYDQICATKEYLLDRIIWTIVEVEDALLYMKAIVRDACVPKYKKQWNGTVIEIFSALLRSDVKKVRQLWPALIESLKRETLLYIPIARGGESRDIVEARRLQQIFLRLLSYVSRLGMITETFQLIECIRTMEQNRLSSPGAITEFDRFVETALRGLTEVLANSANRWNELHDGNRDDDSFLVVCLERVSEIVLKHWLQHSRQILISSVERIVAEPQWTDVKEFIESYGQDIFTQQFLSFRNMRAILHQGTLNYLRTLIQLKEDDKKIEFGLSLVNALISGEISYERASFLLEEVLECVAENFAEFVDYNRTTTQSDKGEKLFIFLDFLRTLSKYERISWNLKPVYWVHDALIRAQKPAAELWKEKIKKQSSIQSRALLYQFQSLTRQYGVSLQGVYSRLQEQFVRPLEIAQMCGLVYDAISEVRKSGEHNPVFHELDGMAEKFAKAPSCVGFDLPDWLTELQDEVMRSRVDCKEERRFQEPKEQSIEPVPFPIAVMSFDEVEAQLRLRNKN